MTSAAPVVILKETSHTGNDDLHGEDAAMIAAEAFLQKIREQPDEDAPRLVYADWLEEQGEPLAELIRVQCQLACLDKSASGRAELKAREAELSANHEQDWLGPLRELGLGGKFQRGLLEVNISGVRTYLKLAAQLFAMPQVLFVKLKDRATHEDLTALAESPYFEHVQHLDLSRSQMGFDGVRRLCSGHVPGKLTHLWLKHNQLSHRALRVILDAFDVRRLEELRLSGNGLGPLGARVLANSPHLGRLRVLDLAQNILRMEGAQALAEAISLNHLRTLDVRGNSIRVAGARALGRRFGPRVLLGSARIVT